MSQARLKQSWKIQRLQTPQLNADGTPFQNPFSFGGGLPRGGLSQEAYNLVGQVWSFDYMGSSEFEFGAVPKALQSMVEDRQKDTLVAEAHSVTMTYTGDWKTDPQDAQTKQAEFYILGRKELCDRAKEIIDAEAPEKADLYRYLEPARIKKSLFDKHHNSTCGWLELDNGFFFTHNYDMFDGLAKLFDVKHEIKRPQVPSVT